MIKGIKFRDRALQPNEKHHHHCGCCGQCIHPDLVGSHKCSPLLVQGEKK